MQVGDTVYLKAVGNNSRYDKEVRIEEYSIKSIGRKYFEVWKDNLEWTDIKFNISSNRQVTNYSPNWEIYFSKQEILNEEEKGNLEKKIRNALGQYGNSSLSLEQLRQIYKIINNEITL